MLNFIIQLYTSKDISEYYKNLGQMVRYSNYSLTEIENMIPYELEIFSSILIEQIKKENQ